jgi:peptidoglycan/LPS O-acetylase OafA/YrhL
MTPKFEHPVSDSTKIRSIEGLRVVALAVFVAWLVQLQPFHGGYVGLDVFFVIAGYFMSRRLAIRVPETTRAFLTDFIAFRLRRVVPVMASVIIVTSAVALILYGYEKADYSMASARSAMLFVANFYLSFSQSHPLSPLDTTSFFQQFWSISVLQQVALLWGVTYHFARRAPSQVAIRRILWTVVVLSVGLSLLTSGELNYYATFTRVAAFAIGALFAVYQDSIPTPSAATRNSLGVAGLAVILAASTLLTADSWYPGPYSTLVAVATVGLLAACVWGEDTLVARVLRFRPLSALGRYTFSYYLWIFPAIVVLNLQTDSHPSAPLRLALVLGVAVVSVITYYAIERPVQNWLDPNDDRVDSRMDYLITYRGTSILVVVTVLFSFGLANMSHYKPITAFTAPPPTENQLAFPEKLDPRFYPHPAQLKKYLGQAREMAGSKVGSFLPGIDNLREDGNSLLFEDCVVRGSSTSSGSCVFGDPNGTWTLALIGDERAASFLAALQPIAQVGHFKVILLSRLDCRNNSAYDMMPKSKNGKACAAWHDSLRSRLADLRPDAILFASDETDPITSTVSDAQWGAGYGRFVQSVASAGRTHVLVNVTGWPHSSVNPTRCLKRAEVQSTCNTTYRDAFALPRVKLESAANQAYGIRQFFIAKMFCSGSTCPLVVQKVATMADSSTISQSYMRLVTRCVSRALLPLLEPFSLLK